MSACTWCINVSRTRIEQTWSYRHIFPQFLEIHIHAYVHIHVNVHIHVHIHVHTHVYVHVYTYTYIRIEWQAYLEGHGASDNYHYCLFLFISDNTERCSEQLYEE